MGLQWKIPELSRRLVEVFQRTREAGPTLKPSKPYCTLYASLSALLISLLIALFSLLLHLLSLFSNYFSFCLHLRSRFLNFSSSNTSSSSFPFFHLHNFQIIPTTVTIRQNIEPHAATSPTSLQRQVGHSASSSSMLQQRKSHYVLVVVSDPLFGCSV